MSAQKASERLREAILGDLPPNLELDARETALLDAAAEQADAIEALEADIAERGELIGEKLNPSVTEARMGRMVLGRLLSGIDLPDSRSAAELQRRRAANERWKVAS